jgi:hypothetical protein
MDFAGESRDESAHCRRCRTKRYLRSLADDRVISWGGADA